MRESLENLIKNAVLVKYSLPNLNNDIDKSIITNNNDYCFESNDDDISKIIYNGIVEFVYNEYKINYDKLEIEQLKAIKSKIRYDNTLPYDVQLRFGFYGEVLIDLLLRVFFNTSVIFARGYFYLPVENSEPKGFDVFHIVDSNNIELWLGEAKFYCDYREAINKVLNKLETTFSDKYIERNLITVFNQKDFLSTKNDKFMELVNSWEENPSINLITQINKYDFKVVYPIFIAFEKVDLVYYDENIKKCIDYINNKVKNANNDFTVNFKLEIYFMFLPINDVNNTKRKVLEYICLKTQLI